MSFIITYPYADRSTSVLILTSSIYFLIHWLNDIDLISDSLSGISDTE